MNTRSSRMKIEIPKINLEAARKSAFYNGAIIVREFPTNVGEETNF